DAIDRGVQRVGEVNPRAHIVLHETVDAQLAGNEPPEVRAAYERLVTAGHEPHSVLHAIAEALGREVWAAQRDRRPFDNARYRARLAALRATDCDDAEAAEELPPATMPPADREKLRGLPRSVRAWEGDLTDLPVEIADRGAPLCAIWTDATDGSVRSLVPDLDAEPGSLALAAFVDAALRPKAGRPELPARVRVHPELATALSFALAGVVAERAPAALVHTRDAGALTRGQARPRQRSRMSFVHSTQGSRHGEGTADHRAHRQGRRREDERRGRDRRALRAARLQDHRHLDRHRPLARGFLRPPARLRAGGDRAEPLGPGVR